MLIEILLCLPVKTLLRFKPVSKSWFSLIDSSDFIHRHANNNSSSKPGTFTFQSSRMKENSRFWNIFSISCDHGYEDFGMAPCYRKPIKSLGNLDMVGYCNGVICLYDDNWNPAIHQFRFLPKSSYTTINSDVNPDFIAGFDVETKDYKVVLVTDQPLFQVYSLSTDSHLVNNVVLPIRPWDKYGGYLNGSYYCSGRNFKKTTEKEVLSFDFTKEIFKTLQLPDEINNMLYVPFRDLGIVFLGGKIAIIHNLYLMHWNTYEFWVLNELGVKESWTKLYTIGPYGRGLSINERISIDSLNGKMYRPIGISNNGRSFEDVVAKSLVAVHDQTMLCFGGTWFCGLLTI